MGWRGWLGIVVVALPLWGQGPDALPALPNPGQRPFRVLTPDDGLPPGGPISIAQAKDGFLWMGTEAGLVRYNRGQCRVWSTEEGLPSAYIGALVADPQEGLWLGTQRGLVRFRGGRFETALFGDAPSQGSIGQVAKDREGRLLVLNAGGLYRQREGLHFDAAAIFPDLDGRLLSVGPRSGCIYLAGTHGIEALAPDGSTRRWTAADGLPAGTITLVAEDGLGRLWVGSGRTLARLEPSGTRFQDQSSLLPGSLSPNSTPMLDGDGSLWIPTQNGALHLSGDGVERLDVEGGLPFRWVRSLFRDREGTLWVLGPTLARLLGGGRVRNYTLTRGGSGELVWAVARDRKGTLLVGTDDGAARLEASGLVRIPGTEGRRIKAITEDHAGTLWMVGTIGPALWLRPGQSRAEAPSLGTLGTSLNSVLEDSQGQLWLGHSQQGLLRWDAAAKRLVPEVGPGFVQAKGLGAFLIREDAQHRLWVGTTAGLLVRVAPGRWKLFTDHDGLRPHSVRGMAFLPDGSAWIHHQEPQGLTHVRVDGERLTVLERRDHTNGLRTDLVYAVESDAQGRVWASTNEGLVRLDPSLHLGRHEGMIDEDCSIHALRVEADAVWVGTSGGLVRYETAPEDAPLDPPRAQVLQALFGERAVDPPFSDLGPVPSRDNTVAFKVAAPTYVNEQDLRFQVRLAGLEDAWHPAEGPVLRYPALPGHAYRFEVRAAHGEGAFGPVAGLAFIVRPPWWQTGWCFALEALGALALIYGLVRWRVAALARSRAELRTQVRQQTQELSLRNEELSSALSHVKQLSGLLPICANCKMIRDKDGSWTQLETYIHAHSEADFTHGICPECIKSQFPELRRR